MWLDQTSFTPTHSPPLKNYNTQLIRCCRRHEYKNIKIKHPMASNVNARFPHDSFLLKTHQLIEEQSNTVSSKSVIHVAIWRRIYVIYIIFHMKLLCVVCCKLNSSCIPLLFWLNSWNVLKNSKSQYNFFTIFEVGIFSM